MMMCESFIALPGELTALLTRCTRRSVFVNVPTFSANDELGNTTCASSAVSVMKMSCTTRKSSALSAFVVCATSGSDSTGFSPMMYRALMMPFSAAGSISVAVMPSLSESFAFQSASNFCWIAGMVTR